MKKELLSICKEIVTEFQYVAKTIYQRQIIKDLKNVIKQIKRRKKWQEDN